MSNLLMSLNVVLPLFLLMALGYLLRCCKLMDASLASKCNTLLFRVFLPVLVFNSIYDSHIREIFDLKLVLFGAIGVTVIFLLLLLIIPRVFRDWDIAATLIQACFRGNVLIFGVPIAMQVFGAEGVGPTALIAVIMIPLFNLFATLAFSHGESSWRGVLKQVALNPFIIASVIGILLVLLDLPLPAAVDTVLDDIAAMASPLALIVLGSCFHFKIQPGTLKPLVTGILVRLVVVPGIMLPLACLLGFTGTFFVAAIAAFATPSSVASYIVAAESGQEGGLAGQFVVFNSLFSVVTIFIIVFIAKTIGLI